MCVQLVFVFVFVFPLVLPLDSVVCVKVSCVKIVLLLCCDRMACSNPTVNIACWMLFSIFQHMVVHPWLSYEHGTAPEINVLPTTATFCALIPYTRVDVLVSFSCLHIITLFVIIGGIIHTATIFFVGYSIDFIVYPRRARGP